MCSIPKWFDLSFIESQENDILLLVTQFLSGLIDPLDDGTKNAKEVFAR